MLVLGKGTLDEELMEPEKSTGNKQHWKTIYVYWQGLILTNTCKVYTRVHTKL